MFPHAPRCLSLTPSTGRCSTAGYTSNVGVHCDSGWRCWNTSCINRYEDHDPVQSWPSRVRRRTPEPTQPRQYNRAFASKWLHQLLQKVATTQMKTNVLLGSDPRSAASNMERAASDTQLTRSSPSACGPELSYWPTGSRWFWCRTLLLLPSMLAMLMVLPSVQ